MECSTIIDVNNHYRDLVRTGVPGVVVEMWRDLAFKDKELVLNDIPGVKMANFYHEAVQASRVERVLPFLLTDYMVFGRFAAHLIYDVKKGYWGACIQLDANSYSFKFSPSLKDPELSLAPSVEQQMWASSTDPRVVEQRENLDPTIIAGMARGDSIPLKYENTLLLIRRAFSSDFFGTSWLSGVNHTMGMSRMLTKLRVLAHRLHDRHFRGHYIDGAARLRDHICNHVFNEKMLPTLAAQHGYTLTPTVEWIDKKNAIDPRDIVHGVINKLKVNLPQLEADQRNISCDAERIA